MKLTGVVFVTLGDYYNQLGHFLVLSSNRI